MEMMPGWMSYIKKFLKKFEKTVDKTGNILYDNQRRVSDYGAG